LYNYCPVGTIKVCERLRQLLQHTSLYVPLRRGHSVN